MGVQILFDSGCLYQDEPVKLRSGLIARSACGEISCPACMGMSGVAVFTAPGVPERRATPAEVTEYATSFEVEPPTPPGPAPAADLLAASAIVDVLQQIAPAGFIGPSGQSFARLVGLLGGAEAVRAAYDRCRPAHSADWHRAVQNWLAEASRAAAKRQGSP